MLLSQLCKQRVCVASTAEKLHKSPYLPLASNLRSNGNSTGQSRFMSWRTTHTLSVTASSTLQEALSRPNVATEEKRNRILHRIIHYLGRWLNPIKKEAPLGGRVEPMTTKRKEKLNPGNHFFPNAALGGM